MQQTVRKLMLLQLICFRFMISLSVFQLSKLLIAKRRSNGYNAARNLLYNYFNYFNSFVGKGIKTNHLSSNSLRNKLNRDPSFYNSDPKKNPLTNYSKMYTGSVSTESF